MSKTNLLETLHDNNDKIITHINDLKQQRDDLMRTIKKQEEEKEWLETEIERLNYKLENLAKSLAQRIVARDRYNEAINEAEKYYGKLVQSSQMLLSAIQKDFKELYESMDKKVGPDNFEGTNRSCQLCNAKNCPHILQSKFRS